MKIITDLQVAQMFAKTYLNRESFAFSAPCGDGTWDGKNVSLNLNGNTLDPEAAKLAPHLIPTIKLPPPKVMPNISDIEQDFNSSLTPLFAHTTTVTEEVFAARLAVCRNCKFWQEGPNKPKGACSAVNGLSSDKLIWRYSVKCPENKWAA